MEFYPYNLNLVEQRTFNAKTLNFEHVAMLAVKYFLCKLDNFKIAGVTQTKYLVLSAF